MSSLSQTDNTTYRSARSEKVVKKAVNEQQNHEREKSGSEQIDKPGQAQKKVRKEMSW